MKRVITGLVLALATAQTASADVYVKIDANGNAISGAIVCDYSVCGDPNSEFNKYNTGVGERWVLQAGNGAQAGFGKSNNAEEQIKVDVTTNVWTSTIGTEVRTILPEPTFVPAKPILSDTNTAITDTVTVVIDTATALIDTSTATITDYFDWSAFWVQFEIWFKTFFTNFWGVKP